MIYITGDTHGDFSRLETLRLNNDDIVIVLGDAGLNYFGDERDNVQKNYANSFGAKIFCIHGNHEMRPTEVKQQKA